MSVRGTAPAPRGVSRGHAYRLIWLLAAFVLCACATPAAVETLCNNRVDEDDDDLMDCEDPDCLATDECVNLHAAEIMMPDAGPRRPPLLDAGKDVMVGDAWIMPPADGATDGETMTPPDGASDGAIGDEDGGAPDDPCSKCGADELCVDGVCQPAPPPTGRYVLRVLSTTVPSADGFSFCYDACLSPPAICACPPDPYVRVLLHRDGKDIDLGSTDVVMNDTDPMFAVVDIEVDLMPGDSLNFLVYDDDEAADADDLLYRCTDDLETVSLAEPMAVQLNCMSRAGLGALWYEVMAELQPR